MILAQSVSRPRDLVRFGEQPKTETPQVTHRRIIVMHNLLLKWEQYGGVFVLFRSTVTSGREGDIEGFVEVVPKSAHKYYKLNLLSGLREEVIWNYPHSTLLR